MKTRIAVLLSALLLCLSGQAHAGWTQWPRRSPALVRFDASTMTNTSTAVVSPPGFMSISCATTGRTTQNSATTILTGFGANAARGRNVGSGWGLSIEKPATNLSRQSNALGTSPWSSSGGAVVNADVAVGPDGTSTADEVDISAGTGRFQTPLGNDGSVTTKISIWGKQSNGANTHILEGAQDASGAASMVLTTSWQRFETTLNAAAFNGHFIINSSGTKKGLYAHAQNETGKYPTSVFTTTTVELTRAADVVTVPTPYSVAPRGFFSVDMTIAPNFANTEQAADLNLLYFGANDRVYLRQSDGTIVSRIGSNNVASSAFTWSREDAIRIVVRHLPNTGRLVRVYKNGVQQGSDATGTATTAIALPSTLGILGDTSTTAEAADLRIFEAFRP